MTTKATTTNESLYNQHITDGEILETIRKEDLDGVYSDFEDGQGHIHSGSVEQVRDQLSTLEDGVECHWKEFAEIHGDGFTGSTDDYLLISARDREEVIENVLGVDGDYSANVLISCVYRIATGLEANRFARKENSHADWVVPLPDDVTLNDAAEFGEDS